jgi:hypothetical protein
MHEELPNRDIPGFKNTSVVVKTLWRVVSDDSPAILSVLDLPPANPTVEQRKHLQPIPPGVPNTDQWQCVGVLTKPGADDGYAGKCGEVVTIDDFFHIPLDQTSLNLMTSEVFHSKQRHGTHAYAILIGMHITTKEIPNWTWATFWWGDRSEHKIYSCDRPPALRIQRRWRRYAMDVAYDMNRPQPAPGVPKICFNPFLEGVIPDGTVSNCMTCHRRAARGIVGSDSLSVFRGIIQKGSPVAFPNPNIARTDFLWSVALNSQSCK